MRISFVIGAEFRDTQGKGAGRRLRVTGKVPAILYGGGQSPRALVLDQQKLLTMIDNEKFYSSIVQLKVANETQAAIVKDGEIHPAKTLVVHLNMQRVVDLVLGGVHLHVLEPGQEPGRAPGHAAGGRERE